MWLSSEVAATVRSGGGGKVKVRGSWGGERCVEKSVFKVHDL